MLGTPEFSQTPTWVCDIPFALGAGVCQSVHKINNTAVRGRLTVEPHRFHVFPAQTLLEIVHIHIRGGPHTYINCDPIFNIFGAFES